MRCLGDMLNEGFSIHDEPCFRNADAIVLARVKRRCRSSRLTRAARDGQLGSVETRSVSSGFDRSPPAWVKRGARPVSGGVGRANAEGIGQALDLRVAQPS